MLFVLLSLACTDPSAVAVAACQALPGVAVHPEDLPLMETLLSKKEIEALKKAPPTKGLQAVSAATLATMRSQTTCTATESNGAGSGRWAVKLTRKAPTVTVKGEVGPPDEQSFEWQVTDEDGGRAEYNVEGATIARGNLDEAIDKEDFKRFAAGWRSLAGRYPDPLLVVDVADAEALLARMEYGASLQHVFVGAAEGMVNASVLNSGDKTIAEMKVDAVFESAAGPVHSEAIVGPLPAGETLTYQVAIPETAEGNVRLRTLDLRFAD